jgi:hypothetical protein
LLSQNPNPNLRKPKKEKRTFLKQILCEIPREIVNVTLKNGGCPFPNCD